MSMFFAPKETILDPERHTTILDPERQNTISFAVDTSGSMSTCFGSRWHQIGRLKLFQQSINEVPIPRNVNVYVVPFGKQNDETILKINNPRDMRNFLKLRPETLTYTNSLIHALRTNPNIFVFYGDGVFSDHNILTILKEEIGDKLLKIFFILPGDTSVEISDKLRNDVGEAIEVIATSRGVAIEFVQIMLTQDNGVSTIRDIYEEARNFVPNIFPPTLNHWIVGPFFSFDRDMLAPEVVKCILENKDAKFVNNLFEFVINTFKIRPTAVANELFGKIHLICVVLNSTIVKDGILKDVMNYNDEFAKLKNSLPAGSPEKKALEQIKEISHADQAVVRKLKNSLPQDSVIGYLLVTEYITRKEVLIHVQSKFMSLDINNYFRDYKIVRHGEGFPILKDGLDKELYKIAAKLFFLQFPPTINISDMLMFSLLIRILGSKKTIDMSEDVFKSIFNAISKEDVLKYLLGDIVDDIFYSPRNYISIANFFFIYSDKLLGEVPDPKIRNRINIWKTIRMFAGVIDALRKIGQYSFTKTIEIEKPQGPSDIYYAGDIRPGDIFLFNDFEKDPCPTMPSVGDVLETDYTRDGKSVFITVEYLDNPPGIEDTLVFKCKLNKTAVFMKKMLKKEASEDTINRIRDYLIAMKKEPIYPGLIFDYKKSSKFVQEDYQERYLNDILKDPKYKDFLANRSFSSSYHEKLMVGIRKIISPGSSGKTQMIKKEITINVTVANFVHILGYPNVISQMLKAGSKMGRRDIESLITSFLNAKNDTPTRGVIGIRENSTLAYELDASEIEDLIKYVNSNYKLEPPVNMIKTFENSVCFCGDDIMHKEGGVFMCACCNPIHRECYDELIGRGRIAPGEYFEPNTVFCPFCKRLYPLADLPDRQVAVLLLTSPEGPPDKHLWRSCKYRGTVCDNIITGLNQADNQCADVVFPDTCDACEERARNISRHEEISTMEICYISPAGSAIHEGHCVVITSRNHNHSCLMCETRENRDYYNPDVHDYGCTVYRAFPDIKLSDEFSISYDWMKPNPFHFYLFSDNVDWEACGKTREQFSTLVKLILGETEFERLSSFNGFNF
jgi:hypothetical protein